MKKKPVMGRRPMFEKSDPKLLVQITPEMKTDLENARELVREVSPAGNKPQAMASFVRDALRHHSQRVLDGRFRVPVDQDYRLPDREILEVEGVADGQYGALAYRLDNAADSAADGQLLTFLSMGMRDHGCDLRTHVTLRDARKGAIAHIDEAEQEAHDGDGEWPVNIEDICIGVFVPVELATRVDSEDDDSCGYEMHPVVEGPRR